MQACKITIFQSLQVELMAKRRRRLWLLTRENTYLRFCSKLDPRSPNLCCCYSQLKGLGTSQRSFGAKLGQRSKLHVEHSPVQNLDICLGQPLAFVGPRHCCGASRGFLYQQHHGRFVVQAKCKYNYSTHL
jgi:hypothetical protein